MEHNNFDYSLALHIEYEEPLLLNQFAGSMAAFDKFYNSISRSINHKNGQHLSITRVDNGSIWMFLSSMLDNVASIATILSCILAIYMCVKDSKKSDDTKKTVININFNGDYLHGIDSAMFNEIIKNPQVAFISLCKALSLVQNQGVSMTIILNDDTKSSNRSTKFAINHENVDDIIKIIKDILKVKKNKRK